MSVRMVAEQPEQLKGREYNPNDRYDWLELVRPDGTVYAVAGATFRYDKRTAWVYWRILDPAPASWRDLRREVVPHMDRWMRQCGMARVCVASYDRADVGFEKMVEFMGFEVLAAGDIGIEWPKVAVLELVR